MSAYSFNHARTDRRVTLANHPKAGEEVIDKARLTSREAALPWRIVGSARAGYTLKNDHTREYVNLQHSDRDKAIEQLRRANAEHLRKKNAGK